MTIVTRQEWNADSPKSRPDEMSGSDGVYVHHTTGQTLGEDNPAAWVRRIQDFHQDGQGWNDIGYSFLVGWDADDNRCLIFEGRGWGIVDARRISKADDSTRAKDHAGANPTSGFAQPVPEVGWEYERTTIGWSDCGHGTWRSGVVFDPFAGTGTTLAVAHGLGRSAIGCDLDARNADLARQRVGMFLEVVDLTDNALAATVSARATVRSGILGG